MSPWLPPEEYRRIFSQVPRLTVEVVIADARGVLLAERDVPPNVGAWHLPGGTVYWGERVLDAVLRKAEEELGIAIRPGRLLGYIEYPSHYENGIDSPVGLAFACEPLETLADEPELLTRCRWFAAPPAALYAEQRAFLDDVGLWPPSR
jgi:ADP-ribose pyrophosphatase YjhB (NUDIX family)